VVNLNKKDEILFKVYNFIYQVKIGISAFFLDKYLKYLFAPICPVWLALGYIK